MSKRSDFNHRLVRWAAFNNAKWCGIVCQANGAPGIFKNQVWYTIGEVPMYYPNIVTLKPSCNSGLIDYVAEKIGGKASLKDSFDILQLPVSKYEKLFDGKWYVVKSRQMRRGRFSVVRTMRDLQYWEQAISASPMVSSFNYKVLSHPTVRIIAVKKGDKITGGCVLTRSKEVVGLTNFFHPAGEQDEYWLICLSAAWAYAGKAPVVGYMRNDLFNLIKPTSIMELGALSVWVRKEPFAQLTSH